MFNATTATRISFMLLLPVAVACAKKDTGAAADSASVSAASTTATTVAPPAATLPLDSLAGKWNMTATPTSGKNKTPTRFVLTATNNTSGWVMNFTGRPPVPAQVTVSGDSVQLQAGPYESVRRKGVQVTTDSWMHLQNGKLVGTTTGHYAVKTADSVLTLATEGTRAK